MEDLFIAKLSSQERKIHADEKGTNGEEKKARSEERDDVKGSPRKKDSSNSRNNWSEKSQLALITSLGFDAQHKIGNCTSESSSHFAVVACKAVKHFLLRPTLCNIFFLSCVWSDF